MGMVHLEAATWRYADGIGLRFDDCSLGHP